MLLNKRCVTRYSSYRIDKFQLVSYNIIPKQ